MSDQPESTDEPVSAMPEDFARTPPDEAWKRIDRTTRRAKRLEADLSIERQRAQTLAGELESTRQAAARLAEVEAELARTRSEAQRWQQRVPLIRLGVEDEEVADLLIQRHAATQASAKEPVAFDAWLREHAAADKIASKLLPSKPAEPAQPAAPPVPRDGPERGASPVTAAPTGRITIEQYRQEMARVKSRGYTPIMRAYMEQEQQKVPDKKYWID